MNYFAGYYQVGSSIYLDKLSAVLAAQKQDLPVRWNFFDQQFQSIDWSVEPDLSLDQLYKIRAQQIRDRYDYLVVYCSGGADSTNVFHSFLDNGILIDEIISLAPISGLSNYQFNNKDIGIDNTVSEVKYALLPFLSKVVQQWPKIRITLYDYFNQDRFDQNSINLGSGNIVTPLTGQFTNVFEFPHILKLLDQGKRVGLVYGSDKPIVKIGKQGNLYLNFIDSAVNYIDYPEQRRLNNLEPVLFYWSADLPELIIKQAHEIIKNLCLPHNHKFIDLFRSDSRLKHSNESLWDRNMQIEYSNQEPIHKEKVFQKFFNQLIRSNSDNFVNSRTVYERFIVPFIYPKIHVGNLFQCQKVDSYQGFFARDQSWLYRLHSHSTLSQMILSNIEQLHKSISSKYLNREGTSFLPMLKYYNFGKIQNFSSELNHLFKDQ